MHLFWKLGFWRKCTRLFSESRDVLWSQALDTQDFISCSGQNGGEWRELACCKTRSRDKSQVQMWLRWTFNVCWQTQHKAFGRPFLAKLSDWHTLLVGALGGYCILGKITAPAFWILNIHWKEFLSEKPDRQGPSHPIESCFGSSCRKLKSRGACPRAVHCTKLGFHFYIWKREVASNRELELSVFQVLWYVALICWAVWLGEGGIRWSCVAGRANICLSTAQTFLVGMELFTSYLQIGPFLAYPSICQVPLSWAKTSWTP